jgi:predicted nucleic acid-binding protein
MPSESKQRLSRMGNCTFRNYPADRVIESRQLFCFWIRQRKTRIERGRVPKPFNGFSLWRDPPHSGPMDLIRRGTNSMNALDTNVWFYSHDSRDSRKQLIAQQLIAVTRPLALPWQVGCEFLAASRKLAGLGFTEANAWAALAAMRSLADAILLPVPDLWNDTEDLQHRYSLSLWDGLLVAQCIRGGVNTLYTEDIGAPRTIDGLVLVNPFLGP